MLRKFLLISVFALCATFYAFGPEWSSVSAQGTIPAAPAPVALPDNFADDFTGIADAPTESTEISFADPNATTGTGTGPSVPPATVDTNPDTGVTTVVLPVGFTNTSDEPLNNVILTAVLPSGQTLPDGSPWTPLLDADGNPQTDTDDNAIVAYGIGSLPAGESIQVPLVTNSNNVAAELAGETITVPTRLDATDSAGGAISLAGEVSQIAQAAPTALDISDEPAQDIHLFLPIISR